MLDEVIVQCRGCDMVQVMNHPKYWASQFHQWFKNHEEVTKRGRATRMMVDCYKHE